MTGNPATASQLFVLVAAAMVLGVVLFLAGRMTMRVDVMSCSPDFGPECVRYVMGVSSTSAP